MALTVRTALVSGVSVPTDNWSFVESQRKSADPEMDEDVSQKVTCPACPPVTVEGHAPSTHTRCPPSARRIPPTSRFPWKVEVPVPPTKSWFATDNCSVGVDVPMPRFPAKYEVADDDVAMKFVAFTVFAIVVEPALLSNDHQFKESICDVESRYPATLFCVPVLTVPRPPPATQVLFIA